MHRIREDMIENPLKFDVERKIKELPLKSDALHRIDNDRLTKPKKNEITSLWHLLGSNNFGKITVLILFFPRFMLSYFWTIPVTR